MARPFLRWAGSKRKLIGDLQVYWGESHKRYVEPFMGSACLFFGIQPQRAVLSDMNEDLIHTYEWVKSEPEEIYDRLLAIPRTPRAYYQQRSKNPRLMKPINKAVRFIYLNRNCFNGIYRTNSKGQFNVPFAGPNARVGSYPSKEEFVSASRLLMNAKLIAGDFENIILNEVRKGDFVYLDPPYAIENRRVFRQYGPQVFGQDDLRRLACCLQIIHKRKAGFVLSYASSPEAQQIVGDWEHTIVQTRRHISGFVGSRGSESEFIITNIDLPA